MQKLGGCGRGSLWYGDEREVLKGRLTSDDEELPEHESTEYPFQPKPSRRDPLRGRGSIRRPPRGLVPRDPLSGRKSDSQLECEWEIANGIYV